MNKLTKKFRIFIIGGEKMYNFLFEEAFWMETIISAIITGGMALLGVYITAKSLYSKSVNDLLNGQKDLSVEHKDLSKEHRDLSKEHRDLFKEHSNLSKEHDDLKQLLLKNLDISNSMFTDKKAEELRMQILDNKCQNIINDIKEISELPKIIMELVEENAKLKEQIKNLEHKNNKLKRLDLEKDDLEM